MTNSIAQSNQRYRLAKSTLCYSLTIYIASMVILVASDVLAHLIATFASSKVLLWTFAASSISSIVGFAFSPIAGSLLFHIVPDHVTAVSILLICSISLQLYSVVALASHIRWSELTPFLAGGLLGLLPGVWMLLTAEPFTLIAAVGMLCIFYGTYTTTGARFSIRSNSQLGDVASGFLGGLTGPIAAFPGAFVTIWCSAKGGDKLEQRAIFQPFILIMQVLCLAVLSIGFQARMDLSPEHFSYALPALLGAAVGMMVFKRLSNKQFQKFLGVFLILAGLSLVAKGFSTHSVGAGVASHTWT